MSNVIELYPKQTVEDRLDFLPKEEILLVYHDSSSIIAVEKIHNDKYKIYFWEPIASKREEGTAEVETLFVNRENTITYIKKMEILKGELLNV